MKKFIKKQLFKIYQYSVFWKDRLLYSFFAKKNDSLGAFSRPRKVLLLTSTGGGNSHGLSFPYFYFKKALKEKLNLYFFEITSNSLESKKHLLSSFNADIVILSVPVRSDDGQIFSKEKVQDFFSELSLELRNKIIFFGPTDDPISPYFGILPDIKLFMMPFTFADPSDYDVTFRGASKFADAMSKIYDLDPIPDNEYRDDIFNSFADPSQRNKLTISWNFTHWRRLIELFDNQQRRCVRNDERPIDVNCRFNQYSGWNKIHRLKSAEIINGMADRYNVIASSHKIPVEQYFEEIENSKIVFSPFGWGAICPKEYEAIMKGCLVIKPTIEHINIFPEVLIPGETYVPVKWDLSDLEEKIVYYLENQTERDRIINNACNIYQKAMSADTFVERVKEIVEKFDASPSVK